MTNGLGVTSEVKTLKKVLIHSPDGGIGKVLPSKAQEWLYEDIVDLAKMQEEYDVFKKLLLCYLDVPSLVAWFIKEYQNQTPQTDSIEWHTIKRGSWKRPDHEEFINSSKVVEVQRVISDMLMDDNLRHEMVAAICALENCSYTVQQILLNTTNDQNGKIWRGSYDKAYYCRQLAKTLLSGQLKYYKPDSEKAVVEQVFPPVPNFVFTRDISIMIGQYVLLSKAAETSRSRESILTKYVMLNYFFKDRPDRIVEINNDMEYLLGDEHERENARITIEGGDVMMVAKDHLLVGCSERTSVNAIDKIIKHLFRLRDDDGNKVLNKISVVVIPKKRTMMHIDTIVTMVDKRTWVLYGPLSKLKSLNWTANYRKNLHRATDVKESEADSIKIVRYNNQIITDDDGIQRYHEDDKSFDSFEDLFTDIGINDFGVEEDDMRFVYCGNPDVTTEVNNSEEWEDISTSKMDGYPFNDREQWTDACNVLAIKEGLIIGYDRNHETCRAFQRVGFKIVETVKLLDRLQNEVWSGLGANEPAEQLAKRVETLRDELVQQDTLFLIPSGELSRARGGSHCMSMPLLREQM